MRPTPEPLVVTLTPGTSHDDIWCDTCQTSAAYECDMLIMDSHGVSRVGIVHGCERCRRDAER